MNNLYFVNDVTGAYSIPHDSYDGTLIAICVEWDHVRQALEKSGTIVSYKIGQQAPIPINGLEGWPTTPPVGTERFSFQVVENNHKKDIEVEAHAPWQPGDDTWCCSYLSP